MSDSQGGNGLARVLDVVLKGPRKPDVLTGRHGQQMPEAVRYGMPERQWQAINHRQVLVDLGLADVLKQELERTERERQAGVDRLLETAPGDWTREKREQARSVLLEENRSRFTSETLGQAVYLIMTTWFPLLHLLPFVAVGDPDHDEVLAPSMADGMRVQGGVGTRTVRVGDADMVRVTLTHSGLEVETAERRRMGGRWRAGDADEPDQLDVSTLTRLLVAVLMAAAPDRLFATDSAAADKLQELADRWRGLGLPIQWERTDRVLTAAGVTTAHVLAGRSALRVLHPMGQPMHGGGARAKVKQIAVEQKNTVEPGGRLRPSWQFRGVVAPGGRETRIQLQLPLEDLPGEEEIFSLVADVLGEFGLSCYLATMKACGDQGLRQRFTVQASDVLAAMGQGGSSKGGAGGEMVERVLDFYRAISCFAVRYEDKESGKRMDVYPLQLQTVVTDLDQEVATDGVVHLRWHDLVYGRMDAEQPTYSLIPDSLIGLKLKEKGLKTLAKKLGAVLSIRFFYGRGQPVSDRVDAWISRYGIPIPAKGGKSAAVTTLEKTLRVLVDHGVIREFETGSYRYRRTVDGSVEEQLTGSQRQKQTLLDQVWTAWPADYLHEHLRASPAVQAAKLLRKQDLKADEVTADVMKQARERAGLSVRSFAAELGVSASLISRLERGKRSVSGDVQEAFLAWRGRVQC